MIISGEFHQKFQVSGGTNGAEGPAGYAHPHYAASLSEFGAPLSLPRSGGSLLKRAIPGTGDHDAMGCYPLFACRNWAALSDDLAELEDRLVSVTVVSDPYGIYSEEDLRRWFPDLCARYKDHHVVDLERVTLESISSHHRRNVRRGLRDLQIEFCDEAPPHLEEWAGLYDRLVERHSIKGISAFSRHCFEGQFRVPGLRVQRAVAQGETVGMVLWYVHGSVAYYHLGAYSERGYALRASYALFWTAFEAFRGRVETVALGAAAGARPGAGTGLDRFKAGWSTGTRPAYLCGRILSPERYAELAAQRAEQPTSYFPAYRSGEFR